MKLNYFGYQKLRSGIELSKAESGFVKLFFNPEDGKSCEIKPENIGRLQTGIRIKINPEVVAIIKIGNELENKGVIQPHCLGVVDADYKDEVLFQVRNNSDEVVTINPGDNLGFIEVQKYNTSEILDLVFSEDSFKNLDRKTSLAAASDITFHEETEIKNGLLKTGLSLKKDIPQNINLKKVLVGPRSSTPKKYPSFEIEKFWSVQDLAGDSNQEIFFPIKSFDIKIPEKASFLQVYSFSEIINIDHVEEFADYDEVHLGSNRKGGFGSTDKRT